MTQTERTAFPPPQVVEAYQFGEAQFETLDSGLINASFLVQRHGHPVAVIQGLHRIFTADVNIDIEAITTRLAQSGLVTPTLIRSAHGDAFIEAEGTVWRCLSFVPGVTINRVENLAQARSAGALVARFHRALDGFEYDFRFDRAGVHDTAAHLLGLEACHPTDDDAIEQDAAFLRDQILQAAGNLPHLGQLPRRICHGDLKISNVRFAENGDEARCLLDLDTIGRQTIAYELGDALRSWCNPSGEDLPEPEIDVDIAQAAIAGYARASQGLLSKREQESIIPGLQTICVELAARFCRDVFDDNYFGWDPQRFASRKEHNLRRARGQLALAASATCRSAELQEKVAACF